MDHVVSYCYFLIFFIHFMVLSVFLFAQFVFFNFPFLLFFLFLSTYFTPFCFPPHPAQTFFRFQDLFVDVNGVIKMNVYSVGGSFFFRKNVLKNVCASCFVVPFPSFEIIISFPTPSLSLKAATRTSPRRSRRALLKAPNSHFPFPISRAMPTSLK